MKIAMVGCGAQGSLVASLFSKEDEVDKLVLCDRDKNATNRAKSWIESFGGKVEIAERKVESTRKEEVAQAAKGCDLIFNATFPNTNIPVMKACLDIGANYIDLLGMPFELPGVPKDETVDAQIEMDDDFKKAGLTAFVSMGVCPGWTDIAAKYIIDQLDTVDEVMLRYGEKTDAKKFIAGFSRDVIMAEWFGPPYPVASENGKVVEVDLLDSEEVYEFPEPVGKMSIYTVTLHTEVRSVPAFIKDKPIRRLELKGGLEQGGCSLKDMWVKLIREQTSKHKESEDMCWQFGQSFIHPADFRKAYNEGIVKNAAVSFAVEVNGTKNGGKVRHTCYNTCTFEDVINRHPDAGHGNWVTVTPSLVMVLMLNRGEIKQRGVIGGTSLDNPKAVMKKINDYGGVSMREKIERPLF